MNKSHIQNEQQTEIKRRVLGRKLKTISSINTSNQTAINKFDQPTISKQDIFINNPSTLLDGKQREQQMSLSHANKSRLQTQTTQISKIQSEVNDISRMKMMFESRINSQKQQSKNHNKSMDKSPNGKSIEKHILKPTHTPNFNKFQNKTLSSSIIGKVNSQGINTDKFSHQLSHYSQVEGGLIYHPSSQKKNRFECSEISNKFADYEYESEFKQSSFEFGQQNRQSYKNDSKNIDSKNASTPTKMNFSQPKLKANEQTFVQRSDYKLQSHCNCEFYLKEFMEQTNNKMAEITQRLMHLQNQNARLRKLQNKFTQNNKLLTSYKNQAESMETECNELKQSNYSNQVEKEELESLLKELLFKREKEKYNKTSHSSKQNTQRSQFQSQFSMQGQKSQNRNNYLRDQQNAQQNFSSEFFYNKNNAQSKFKKDHTKCLKKDIEPLGPRVVNMPSFQRQKFTKSDQKVQKLTDSKMKVQNFLSKIQIKIQKS